MANPTIKVYTAGNDGLSASSFVPLIVPMDCHVYLLKNNGPDALVMRSDIDDPLTEDSIPAGGGESISMGSPGKYWSQNAGQARYAAGDTLYFVKCTGPLVGKFWR